MGFKEELKAFTKTVINLQNLEEREFITDDEAIAAINILNYVKYNKVPDIFLGCAAYNLLNAYVKQKNNRLSCHFHRFIHKILKGVEDVNQPKTIKMSFDTSEHLNLLIIAFWDFQFSFQSIRFTEDREYVPLENIDDNYPKYIVTRNDLIQKRNGIIHVNAGDFMANGEMF